MKKIEIKNRFTNKVIFSHECENNTIKITVEQAVKVHANLSNANLSNANLSNANLSSANLSNADLSNADLSNANLSNADLSNADLSNSKNLDKTVKLPMCCKWTHGITNGNLIHIGCEKRTIEEWDLFFSSDKIISTERNTPEFKQIQAVYEAYKAYLQFLNK
jgi:hypothetical protein